MDVAIIGLGRFGTQLAHELVNLGVQVFAIDRHPGPVNQISEMVFLAAEGDATDIEFLESLDLHSYGTVVIAIGSDVAASVLLTLVLKRRLKHRYVVCKASTVDHATALELAGADAVVNPEREAAVRLAHTLGSRGVSDYMALGGDYGIARVRAPFSAEGKEIGELDFVRSYKLFLIGRIRDDSVSFNPDLHEIVQSGDIWIVAGTDADLRRLNR